MMKWLILPISCIFVLETTYAQPPAGYYNNAFGKKKDALKTAMKEIIRSHTERSYDDLWTDFKSTDNKGNNIVWDMYSDIPGKTPQYIFYFGDKQCGNYSGEGSCYNREHSFPKSWFDDKKPMYSDLFHLYPTDGYVNGRRSNHPFGEVGSATWTSSNGSKVGSSSFPGYSGTVFEPIDTYKGDFARTYFYMVTCYEENVSTWSSAMLNGTKYPAFSSWAINLLLKWSRNDAVSIKEYDRNNAVYKIQKNRNPYIDFPQLAEYVWGDSINYAFNPGTTPIPDPDPDPDPGVDPDPDDPDDPVNPLEYLVEFNGDWSKMPSGFTKSGSTGYYDGNGQLALKASNANLVVHFDGIPDKLSFDMTAWNAWGSNNNHVLVSESDNGSGFGDAIADFDNKFLTDNQTKNSGNIQLQPESRYIKIEYQKGNANNVGISNLKISQKITSGYDSPELSVLPMVYAWQGTLYVANSSEGAIVQVYNAFGQLISQSITTSGTYSISLPENGFFIVRIVDRLKTSSTYKIINR